MSFPIARRFVRHLTDFRIELALAIPTIVLFWMLLHRLVTGA